MKLKSLFMFTAVALTVAGCSSDNGPSVNPRLVKPSTYSLSIYATDRANINVYSPCCEEGSRAAIARLQVPRRSAHPTLRQGVVQIGRAHV